MLVNPITDPLSVLLECVAFASDPSEENSLLVRRLKIVHRAPETSRIEAGASDCGRSF